MREGLDFSLVLWYNYIKYGNNRGVYYEFISFRFYKRI